MLSCQKKKKLQMDIWLTGLGGDVNIELSPLEPRVQQLIRTTNRPGG